MLPQVGARHRLPAGTAVAIYFKEDGGFLYLSHLGSGSHGQVALVRPVDDGANTDKPTFFARKRALGEFNGLTAEIDQVYPVRDFSYPGKPHPFVPRALNPVFFGSETYAPGFPGHALRFEHLNGGDLAHLCRQYARSKLKAPEAFIWSVLIRITRVLVRLHLDKMAHCDISPRNVFLRYDGPTDPVPKVFVGDFGLARPATSLAMICDFRGLVTTMITLAACHLGRYPPTRPFDLDAIWSPYSGTLHGTITQISHILDSERHDGLLANLIDRVVEQRFLAWSQTVILTDLASEGSVAWTRPEQPTMPLFFNEMQFACLIGGHHPKYREIFGGWPINPEKYVDHLGIAPPWEFAIVDKSTLSIVKVLTHTEVREFAKSWGTIINANALELRERSGWRPIPHYRPLI